MTEKTIIFGNSGSGKSTLAKKLQQQHQVAHLDLDTLAWEPTDPPIRKLVHVSKQLLDEFISAHNGWVIEGCYADLLHLVAPQANQAIFMNLSVKQCQQNAKNRSWEPHKYESKAAQDSNLPMLLEWIAAYDTREDEFSCAAHASLYQQFSGAKQQITKNQNEQSIKISE